MVRREAAASGPVDASARSALLDSLRGWALLGILIANMVAFIGFSFLNEAQRSATIGSGLDDLAELLIETLIVGKFYSIFSLLFGIGFAIQIGRLAERGEGTGRYLRRLGVLFLIGLAHIFLMWLGDIVALYALMGTLLLLFRRRSDRALVLWAIGLWLIPVAWSALIQFGGVDASRALYAKGISMLTAVAETLDPLPYYRDAGFIQALEIRPAEAFFRLGDLVYQMRFTKVLGMFLIGLWVGRRALYRDPAAHLPLLRRVAGYGIGIGLPLSLARALADMAGPDTPVFRFLVETLYVLSTPTLALGYAAGATLLWARGRKRILQWAAPAGRMALTNYLTQTIANSLFFYGWGLALIGRFGLVFVFVFSAALFALQVAWSRWWLARFRFGPVEWLWRSVTYGRRQPMRVASA